MNKYQAALKEEVKNRARIYYLIYRELAEEIGEAKALTILKKATYERGKEKGRLLGENIAPPDLRNLADAFVAGKEDIDVFGHEVVEVDENHALLRLNHCPLVEAWDEMGLSADERRKMCDFAYQVDFGKFEAAGYRLHFDCRIADGKSSCDLRVTK